MPLLDWTFGGDKKTDAKIISLIWASVLFWKRLGLWTSPATVVVTTISSVAREILRHYSRSFKSLFEGSGICHHKDGRIGRRGTAGNRRSDASSNIGEVGRFWMPGTMGTRLGRSGKATRPRGSRHSRPQKWGREFAAIS